MMKAPISHSEQRRLAELDRLKLLYTPPEDAFDRVTRQLARIFNVPVASMSLTDRDTQFYKSGVGLTPHLEAVRIMPRSQSICAHVVGDDKMLVIEDLEKDARFVDNPAVREWGARFYAGAPLRTDNGQPIGSLCIMDFRPRQMTDRERALLQLVADGVMVEVKLRTVSRELAGRNEILERDLNRARAVQQFLLPGQDQQAGPFTVSHLYHPFRQIGGDFLDMRKRGDNGMYLIVADAAGHGASAALTSAMVKTAFSRAADAATGPAEILLSINLELGGFFPPGMFITAMVALLDIRSRTVSLASAGHPYPIMLRNGLAETVQTDNDLPLLIDSAYDYRKRIDVVMQKSDRLLLFTDGAIEATDATGSPFGFAGMMRAAAASARSRDFLADVFESVRRFSNGEPRDDIALMSIMAG